MASRKPVLARVAECSETAVKQAADTGAAYVVVPHVRTSDTAADIVNWGVYPPVGRRSVGLSRNTRLGHELGRALSDTTVPGMIAQIEDADGVENVAGISATPGLGGLFLGPFDLSASLGAPGDFSSERFRSAVRTVVHSAHSASLPVGVFAPTVQAWSSFRGQGCDYVVLGSDGLHLAAGAVAALRAVTDPGA